MPHLDEVERNLAAQRVQPCPRNFNVDLRACVAKHGTAARRTTKVGHKERKAQASAVEHNAQPSFFFRSRQRALSSDALSLNGDPSHATVLLTQHEDHKRVQSYGRVKNTDMPFVA